MSLERVANIVRFDYGKDSSKTALLDIVQQSVLINYSLFVNIKKSVCRYYLYSSDVAVRAAF